VVRDLLEQLGYLNQQKKHAAVERAARVSKLDPFRQRIRHKVDKGLTVSRILREIRAEGYSGCRSILADYVRTLRSPTVPSKKVWRRFETRPAEELQVDWSPYRVPLGGRQRTVYAFAATLGYSRKTHVRFYLDDRQSTLLEAHTHAFDDFGGVTQRVVYDRMATVVLGTIGRQRRPLWHPRFIDFAHYYGFEPYLCRVRDPDRKGKDERIFWYLERDFIRGSEFDSLDDLNARARLWLDGVANRRIHGTTRRVPDEVFELEERELLITLPESRFAVCDEQMRQVGPDAVISVRGTAYTVPARLAHQKVYVRLFAAYFEVLDQRGRVAFSHDYVPEEQKGRLVLDPSHYDGVHHRAPPPAGSAARLEHAFVERFPALAELVDGIKVRMKGLAHIHLRVLWRLAEQYGDEAFYDVAKRVQAYRRFDANAVRRILERDHPLQHDEPASPLNASARAVAQLGDVDCGSLDEYAHLDSEPSSDTGEQDAAGPGDDDTTPETSTEE
jgi:transposase